MCNSNISWRGGGERQYKHICSICSGRGEDTHKIEEGRGGGEVFICIYSLFENLQFLYLPFGGLNWFYDYQVHKCKIS